MLIIKQIVNSVFASNTYIISEDCKQLVWLIDIGDFVSLEKNISDISKLQGVFLTHTHYDHIYGLKRLLDINPDISVYTSAYGAIALQSSKKNLSRYWGDAMELQVKNLVIVGNGDKIVLSEHLCMDVWETPGHDESCLTYSLENSLFTGDSFIPGTKVVTSLPTANKEKAAQSLLLILRLAEGKDLYPGHGPSFLGFHSGAS